MTIPGLSTVRLVLYGIAVAAVIGSGLYVRHLHNQAQRIPGLEQAIVELQKHAKYQRESNQKALEKENALQKELASVRNTAAALASRLRRAYTNELPAVAASPAESVGAAGSGSGPAELDDAVTRVIAACKSDSIRLGGWQQYYDSLSPEYK